ILFNARKKGASKAGMIAGRSAAEIDLGRYQTWAQFEPLRPQLRAHARHTREVAAWPVETGNKANSDRVDSARETGYADGQNIAVEFHWASGQYARSMHRVLYFI